MAKNVYILPLKPDGAEWSAVEKNETTTILPGVVAAPPAAPATTARAFLLREINNVLVHGSVRELFEVADFLGHQPSRSLPAEVITQLHGSLPPQSTRVQELAAVFFASAALSKDDLKMPSEGLGGGKEIASVL